MPRVHPLLALALALPVGAQTTRFRDVSDERGVVFEHRPGNDTFGMGGGAAFADLDGDGDDDLVLVGGAPLQTVYTNADGVFEDATQASGLLTPARNSTGVLAGDYDQDGRTDLYVYGRGANHLFRNRPGLPFEDVGPPLGVAGSSWSAGASWADFDLDGDLDLYVGNYLEQLSFPYHTGAANQLYVNEGAALGAPFVDRAPALGVDDRGLFGPLGDPYFENLVPPPPIGEPAVGCTLSVATLDFDEDGDPDLQVGNDFGMFVLRDALYRNDLVSGGALAFTEVSTATGFDETPVFNMGVHGADYDHDGDWDFYLSNLGDNVLLRNEGGVFANVTAAAGPVEGLAPNRFERLTSWATSWTDFDNDGWEDLLVVNGYIPAATYILNQLRSADALWRNLGDGTFARVDDLESGLGTTGVGRGLATSDVDGDGRMDVLVVNNGSWVPLGTDPRSRLYRNEATGGGFLKLRLRGRRSNLEGLGARVVARAGDQVWRRQVLADPVYQSSSTRVVHLGLGAAAEVDLTVHWPAGDVQQVPALPADLDLVLREPRVFLDRLTPAVRTPGGLQVVTLLRNPDDVPVNALVVLHVGRVGRAGPGFTQRRVVALAPGAHLPLAWSLPDPPAGLERFAARAYLAADGAVDGRGGELVVPAR